MMKKRGLTTLLLIGAFLITAIWTASAKEPVTVPDIATLILTDDKTDTSIDTDTLGAVGGTAGTAGAQYTTGEEIEDSMVGRTAIEEGALSELSESVLADKLAAAEAAHASTPEDYVMLFRCRKALSNGYTYIVGSVEDCKLERYEVISDPGDFGYVFDESLLRNYTYPEAHSDITSLMICNDKKPNTAIVWNRKTAADTEQYTGCSTAPDYETRIVGYIYMRTPSEYDSKPLLACFKQDSSGELPTLWDVAEPGACLEGWPSRGLGLVITSLPEDEVTAGGPIAVRREAEECPEAEFDHTTCVDDAYVSKIAAPSTWPPATPASELATIDQILARIQQAEAKIQDTLCRNKCYRDQLGGDDSNFVTTNCNKRTTTTTTQTTTQATTKKTNFAERIAALFGGEDEEEEAETQPAAASPAIKTPLMPASLEGSEDAGTSLQEKIKHLAPAATWINAITGKVVALFN